MPRTKKQPAKEAARTDQEDRMEEITTGPQLGAFNPDADDMDEEENEDEGDDDADDWDEDDEDDEDDEEDDDDSDDGDLGREGEISLVGVSSDDDEASETASRERPTAATDQPSSFSPGGKPAKPQSEPISEHDALKAIAEAEQKCSLTEARVNVMRENFKNIKKEYDGQVISLRKLCAALKNDSDRPLFNSQNGSQSGVASKSAEQPAATTEPPAATQTEPATDPNAWRHVPLIEMPLEGIKGLGPKKLETLVHNCPNMGEFEDLRAGAGLTSLEGIGVALASELENAMLNWLAKNRDAEVIAAARGETVAASSETAATDQQKATANPETEPAEIEPAATANLDDL